MMSNYGPDLSKLPSRPNHQASSSVPELPPSAVGRHHHHHGHLYRHSKDHKDEKVTLSAGPISHTNAIPKPRSVGGTPISSRSGSRRESLLVPWDENAGMTPRKVVTDDEVREAKQRDARRSEQLSKSLAGLSTLSNNTTRHLDITYYSVLEKVSALQSTITSLKELATMVRDLNDEFQGESHDIVRDMEAQLNGFDDFQEPRSKIEGLEKRITQSRDKIKTLGGRVDTVRHKVDKWEAMEGEWHHKMRKRFRWMWGIGTAILVVLVTLLTFQYTPAATQGPSSLRGLNVSGLKMNMSTLDTKLMNDTLHLKRPATDALEALKRPTNCEVEEDPRFRAFDEL